MCIFVAAGWFCAQILEVSVHKVAFESFHFYEISYILKKKKKFRCNSLFSLRMLLVKATGTLNLNCRIKIECVHILKNILGVLGPLKGNQELINMQ